MIITNYNEMTLEELTIIHENLNTAFVIKAGEIVGIENSEKSQDN